MLDHCRCVKSSLIILIFWDTLSTSCERRYARPPEGRDGDLGFVVDRASVSRFHCPIACACVVKRKINSEKCHTVTCCIGTHLFSQVDVQNHRPKSSMLSIMLLLQCFGWSKSSYKKEGGRYLMPKIIVLFVINKGKELAVLGATGTYSMRLSLSLFFSWIWVCLHQYINLVQRK